MARVFFSSDQRCIQKLGKSISPMPARIRGAKGFQVRFAFPGCGKSGGLRLAVLAFCADRIVKIAGAWRRKDDPDEGDFDAAFRAHDTSR